MEKQVTMDGLDGKVALILGGTSGVGLATAEAMARRGAHVVLGGRGKEKGERAVAQVRDKGCSASYRQVDILDSGSVEAVVANVVDEHGRLDIAFNNVGYDPTQAELAQVSEPDWSAMIDTKLSGTWRAMKYELAQMAQQADGGAIVNMAGSWGLVGAAGQAPYCAAAHGIMGLTRAAALDYAKRSIRVNAVCPGAIRSPMLSRMTGGDDAFVERHFAETLAIGRVAEVDEVAEAVAWLASPGASYVNGIGLSLDGGG